MSSLDSFAKHYGTDKSSDGHNYTEYYEVLFKTFRKRPVRLLEIGVAGGESLRMWADYFYHPESRIYGVDIEDRPLPEMDKKIQVFITDACSPNAVHDISNVTGKLDILIDDGSHRSDQLKSALRLWWPHIAHGGIYCAEDLHAQYHYPWTDQDEVKFTNTLDTWIDALNEHGRDMSGKPSLEAEIEEMVFRKSFLAIKKR